MKVLISTSPTTSSSVPSLVPSSVPPSSPSSTFDRLEHAKDDFKRNICHQIDQLFGVLLAELNIVNATQKCDDDNSKALDLTIPSRVKQQNILSFENHDDIDSKQQQQQNDDEVTAIQELPLNLSVACVTKEEDQKMTKRSLEQLNNKNVLETQNTKKHCGQHSRNISSDSGSNMIVSQNISNVPQNVDSGNIRASSSSSSTSDSRKVPDSRFTAVFHPYKSCVPQTNNLDSRKGIDSQNIAHSRDRNVSHCPNVPQSVHNSRNIITTTDCAIKSDSRNSNPLQNNDNAVAQFKDAHEKFQDCRTISDTQNKQDSGNSCSIPSQNSTFREYKSCVPHTNNLDSARNNIIESRDIRDSRTLREPQNIPESRNSILYQAKVVPQCTSATQNIPNSRNSTDSQNNNNSTCFQSFSPMQSDPNILAEIKQEILEKEQQQQEQEDLKNKLLNETLPNSIKQKPENVPESSSSPSLAPSSLASSSLASSSSTSPSSALSSSLASTSDDHSTPELRINPERSRHSSPSSKPTELPQLKLNHIEALTMECFNSSCHESFRTKVEHSRHMFYTHDLYPILCPVTSCGRSYRNLSEWKLHAAHRHPKMNHCSICSKSFTNVHALYGHVIEEHQKGQFVCPNSKSNCTYIGDYLGNVAIHIKTCDHGREDGELPQSSSNHFDQNLMVLKCRECDGATLLNPNDLLKFNISEFKIRNFFNIDPKVPSLGLQCFYTDCRSAKIFRETKYLIQHANDAHVLCHCGEPVPDKGRFEMRWDRR